MQGWEMSLAFGYMVLVRPTLASRDNRTEEADNIRKTLPTTGGPIMNSMLDFR